MCLCSALVESGERLSVAELDRTVEYTYDNLYRLTGETITEGEKVTAYTYAYDNVGNRILKTEKGKETVYAYNELNQLAADSDNTYEYDLNGNLVRVIGGAQSALYEYNSDNKLVKATVQNGSLVIEESYTYDYAGNRTSKSTSTSDGKIEFVKYLNDNSSLTNVLAEIDSEGNVQAYYTIGADLISQERDGKVYVYLYDGHGSITALSDESGKITDTYSYDAFGNLLKSTGRTSNNYRYCGEQFDSTTGLYYLRARYMDTSTGRFISMDSYQGNTFEPDTLHKYLYANSNPITYSDPSGYFYDLNSLNAGTAGGAVINNINTPNYINLFRTLVAAIKGAVATYGIENIIALAMIPFAVFLGGKLAITYSNSILSSTLSEIFTYPQQKGTFLAIMLMTSGISSYVLNAAGENTKSNDDYPYPYAIHHIVPKGLTQAIPSVMVLKAVGISVYEKNYKNAYYNPAISTLNLVKIKTKTHVAIHSNNYLYCEWVNGTIVPSYLATYKLGTPICQTVVASVLTAMGLEIQAIDSLIL